MNHTEIRHTLPAFVAVALVSLISSSPAFAVQGDTMNMFQVIQKETTKGKVIKIPVGHNPVSMNKTPKGLETTKRLQQTGDHIPSMMGHFVPTASREPNGFATKKSLGPKKGVDPRQLMLQAQ